MATEDDIVLRLVIKGMDPAEVMQLVQSTQGDLNIQMGRKLDELTALHKQANEAQTKETKKRIAEEMKDAQQEIASIMQVQKAQGDYYKAQEKAAKAAADEIVRANKDIAKAEKEAAEARAANTITIAASITAVKSAIDLISGGFGKFQALGEELVRVTNIYGSLKGSIDEMRDATGGEVADIDLITAKNRAFEKDLKLTDKQLGVVAGAANKFADAMGIDTKQALDKMIDGLATGNVKMLEHAGVVIDAERAYKDFAAANGLVVESMSEQQKIQAVQNVALQQMAVELQNVGDKGVTVAHMLAQAFATTKNAVTGALAAVGGITVGKAGGLASEAQLAAERARAQDMADFARFNPESAGFATDDLGEMERANDISAAQRKAAQDKAYNAEFGDETITGLNENVDGQQTEMQRLRLMHQGLSDKELAKIKSKKIPNKGYFPFGQEGEDFDSFKHKAKDQTDYGPLTMTPGEERDPKEEARILSEFMDRKKKLQEVVDAAGGPIMSRLMFGPDGPKQTLEEMDAFGRASIESMGLIADAGQKMAEALGASLAATIAGGKGAKKSMRDTTEAVLEGLAAQALTHALFETAMGLADLAVGNPGSLVHFAAAAKFGAVGVAAGLAARAIGNDAPAAASSNRGGTSSSSSGFNTPRSTATDTSKSTAPITINLSVWPGGEAEAGRQVAKALGAYTRESGQSIVDLTTGKAAA